MPINVKKEAGAGGGAYRADVDWNRVALITNIHMWRLLQVQTNRRGDNNEISKSQHFSFLIFSYFLPFWVI